MPAGRGLTMRAYSPRAVAGAGGSHFHPYALQKTARGRLHAQHLQVLQARAAESTLCMCSSTFPPDGIIVARMGLLVTQQAIVGAAAMPRAWCRYGAAALAVLGVGCCAVWLRREGSPGHRSARLLL